MAYQANLQPTRLSIQTLVHMGPILNNVETLMTCDRVIRTCTEGAQRGIYSIHIPYKTRYQP